MAIVDHLREQVLAGDRLFSPGVLIGIAARGSANEEMDELLQRADLALSSVKHSGGHGFAWYSQKMADQAARRRVLADELTASLATGKFGVHYQTIHSAKSPQRSACGSGALAEPVRCESTSPRSSSRCRIWPIA